MRRVIPLLILAACADPDGPETESQSFFAAIAGPWAIPAEILAAGDQQTVTVTGAGPWRGEAGCGGTFTDGARQLQQWVQAHWPAVSSIGGYSCRPINGNPNVMSVHATGRALDIFIPLDGGEADNDLGDPLANFLVANAEHIGIQRVIWDRWIWAPDRAPGARGRAYNGAHPHHDHLHVELSVAASNLETAFFRGPMGPPDMMACGEPLPAAGGVVDNDDACFAAYGPARFWRSEGGTGYAGGLLWTNAFDGANPSNWARWTFELQQAGEYDVAVHVDRQFSVYDAVRYEVRHRNQVESLVIDPTGQDGWVSLGRFRFAAGEPQWVSVFDNYAQEPGENQHIVADAVRLQSPATPPPPDPDAGPPPPRPDMGDIPPPPPDDDAGLPPDQGRFIPPDRGVTPQRDAYLPDPDDDPMPGADAFIRLPEGQEAKGVNSSGGCSSAPGAPSWVWLLLALAALRRRLSAR